MVEDFSQPGSHLNKRSKRRNVCSVRAHHALMCTDPALWIIVFENGTCRRFVCVTVVLGQPAGLSEEVWSTSFSLVLFHVGPVSRGCFFMLALFLVGAFSCWPCFSWVLFHVGPVSRGCFFMLVLFLVGLVSRWPSFSLVLFHVGPVPGWCFFTLVLFLVGLVFRWSCFSLVLFHVGPVSRWCFFMLVQFLVGAFSCWSCFRWSHFRTIQSNTVRYTLLFFCCCFFPL